MGGVYPRCDYAPYDRRPLESVRGRPTLTIIHAHGEQPMFERLARPPGPPEAAAEAQDAVTQTQGVGLIVWRDRVLPVGTRDENVAAVVKALGGPLKRVPSATG